MHKLHVEAAASPASDSDFEPLPGCLVQHGRKLRSAGPQVFYRLGDPQPHGGLPEGDPGKLKDVASAFVEEQHLSVDDDNKSEPDEVSSPVRSVSNHSDSLENENTDSEVDDEPDDMAEDKMLMPSPFLGRSSDDADDFYQQFTKYVAYKELNDEKQFALFKVLLSGQAGLWLEGLPANKKDTWANMKTSFETTYRKPILMKYRCGKEIFSRRQLEGETVDDYVAYITEMCSPN